MRGRVGGTTRYRLAIAALLLAGAAIRFTHVDFGLPSFYHPDEERKAKVIELILAGEPHDYLNHPGLLLNSVALLCALLRALGHEVDLPAIVLAGRSLVAVVGSLTVLPGAALANMLFGRGAGLFAGALLAFSPIHTIHSRYMKEDVYLAFCVLLSLWAMARWLRSTAAYRASSAGGRMLATAFAAAGLALASKYVGAIAVLLVVEVWRRASGASWWRAIAAVLAIVLIPVLVTPQIFTAFGHERSFYSFLWEMRHGTIGWDNLTLHFFEWPDLGTYFLFHGLGWGLSWPIAMLAIAFVVAAWRRRRTNDLALGMTVIAAVLWYAAAEATPLKRAGDVERYVVPCAAIWIVLAAGWIGDAWAKSSAGTRGADSASRSNGSRGALLTTTACALTLLPLAHSLLLTSAIDEDTRRVAALWLRENGPRAPYEIAHFGARAYQLDASLLDGVTFIKLRNQPGPEAERAVIERVEVLAFSELDERRFTEFPTESRKQLAVRDRLRASFPVELHFRKPAYLKAGFHNPDIEIRLRSGQAVP